MNYLKAVDLYDKKFARSLVPLVEPLRRYFRYEVKEIGNIPREGGAILVMNHGIITFHAFLLSQALYTKLGLYPRGLGASFLFEIPLVRDFFLKGGLVNASPQNGEALLRSGAVVIVAPGGIYEALIAKKGMRRIPWERRTGFVELAVKTGKPIVPTYCQGINSAYFNSDFLLKPRIKLLEKTRFSFPFFFGLGFLPLPVKLVHVIGKPIHIDKKRGEKFDAQVKRIHAKVVSAMVALAKRK